MIENLENMTIEELETKLFHTLNIKDIIEFIGDSELFNIWPEIHSLPKITKNEILDCVKQGKEELTITESFNIFNSNTKEDLIDLREKHIKKIAYFYVNEPEKPIEIELFDNISNHLITDGNHRFFGRYLKGCNEIKTCIYGDINIAKELGLYNPNEYYLELIRREEIKSKEILEKRLNEYIEFLNKKIKKGDSYLELTFSELMDGLRLIDNLNFHNDSAIEKNKIQRNELINFIQNNKNNENDTKSFLKNVLIELNDEIVSGLKPKSLSRRKALAC